MGRKDKKGLSEKQEACHKLNFLHQVSKVSIVLKSVVSTFILKAYKKYCIFLTQASHAVLAINPDNVAMSRYYASTMKEIARKLVYKL